jgi:hypothetical protein
MQTDAFVCRDYVQVLRFCASRQMFDTAAVQPEAMCIVLILFLFLFKALRSSAGRLGLFHDQATRVRIQAR